MSLALKAHNGRTTGIARKGAAKRVRHAATPGRARSPGRGPAPAQVTIRRRSRTLLFGLPLWEIASGPDPKRGEGRGHARAIFAVGDVADGVFALGGIARGGVTVGGVSLGVLSLGGVAASLLGAVGGVAIAPFAYGGVAIGCVAVGGAAVGIYARGDTAVGRYVVRNRHPMRTIRKLIRGLRT